MILALQLGLWFCVTFTIADRIATLEELASTIMPMLAILLVWTFMARRIAELRRPYDEWLMLDIAE